MKKFSRSSRGHALLLSLVLALIATPLVAKENAAQPEATASIRVPKKTPKNALPSMAKISFSDALKTALTSVPGSVIEAGLENEDGGLIYSFEIASADKTIAEIKIDAGNGKVLSVAKETAGDNASGKKGEKHHEDDDDDDEKDDDKK